METVDLDGMTADAAEQERQSVSGPLEASEFAMNYYVLDPGEAFTDGLHAHLDQEEAFLILEGEATFETKPALDAESETVTVGEGELVRFGTGEYQQGRNESDERLRALALGAPQGSTDIRVAAPCRNCGDSDYLEFTLIDGEPGMVCPECGTEVEA